MVGHRNNSAVHRIRQNAGYASPLSIRHGPALSCTRPATFTSVNESMTPKTSEDHGQIVKKLASDPIQSYRIKGQRRSPATRALLQPVRHFNQSVSCTFLIRLWLMNGSTVLAKACRTC